ncbi:recombinase RecQ [Loigolactobacillus backii]|uniref:RecQ family ATP-dependent DNA helicase n=1 Tax=Loigolactobacillus backii TaxID=375175 RepID=UPI0007F134BF|nr:RecQ family ATP-dependent DNA helicase [Loigolactobacillus backii]ANK59573.1 recombinase RecQ [Loigolactobacillus backii]ANK64567.1 recombinase RecQ [Loigolactobacillus backii]ANK67038.1 recombinase RecQ [Loigolactobacillus backii]OLF70716.1 ATP-dependent DNA helicase RecQ [Loigolactobacillus backii]PIO87682.1 recombinase RecQ [Loigolactobacillus backii]
MNTAELTKILTKRFGYTTFKPGQLDVIQAVLAGQDTFAVLPTGTGKSLCYQLPGYATSGSVVIVSPLLSLMQDQVARLHYLGEKKVVALTSDLTIMEKNGVLQQLQQYRFIFLSPEMANQPRVRTALGRLEISLLAIDEAHCISQWGTDFRPDYLELASLREQLQPRATLAMTATATKRVQADILVKLGLTAATTKKVIYSVDRPNIYLDVQQYANESEKERALIQFCRQLKKPGIVYFSSKQKSEEMADKIQKETGIRTSFYHGDLPSQDRYAIQQQFMQGDLAIICATTAFGMGINKANIRFVLHYHLASNLESYLQETGRAGRDGQQSIAILLFQPSDIRIQANLMASGIPDKGLINQYFKNPNNFKAMHFPEIDLLRFYQQHGYSASAIQQLLQKRQEEKRLALGGMLSYITTPNCKRQFILTYFADHKSITCDNDCCCHNQMTDYLEQLNLITKKEEQKESVAYADWQSRLKQLFFTEY